MANTLTITGASDDLIEIEGDIREEIGCYGGDDSDEDDRFLAISNGTLLRVVYDKDGIWRFAVVCVGNGNITKVEGNVDQDTNDVVTITSPIGFTWAALSEKVVRK